MQYSLESKGGQGCWCSEILNSVSHSLPVTHHVIPFLTLT